MHIKSTVLLNSLSPGVASVRFFQTVIPGKSDPVGAVWPGYIWFAYAGPKSKYPHVYQYGQLYNICTVNWLYMYNIM